MRVESLGDRFILPVRHMRPNARHPLAYRLIGKHVDPSPRTKEREAPHPCDIYITRASCNGAVMQRKR